MAELVLLSFPRAEIDRLHMAAERGDKDALKSLETLWSVDYAGQTLLCFLCDAEIPVDGTPGVPFTMIVPDPAQPNDRVTAAALCQNCAALPRMVRWHRSFKLIKRMHKARFGRQWHFNLTPSR